jgi:hypothetical protein
VSGAEAEAILACTLLLGIPTRRRNWGQFVYLLVFLIALASGELACVMAAAAAEAGEGEGDPGTTAGTQTVAITCISRSATETGKVTRTVQ